MFEGKRQKSDSTNAKVCARNHRSLVFNWISSDSFPSLCCSVHCTCETIAQPAHVIQMRVRLAQSLSDAIS